jgi:hypothetical protein
LELHVGSTTIAARPESATSATASPIVRVPERCFAFLSEIYSIHISENGTTQAPTPTARSNKTAAYAPTKPAGFFSGGEGV